jgi:PAS domain S-box-containing protein
MADGGTLPASWHSAAFEQLADESLEGVWICDRDLRCLYWNAAMERLSGLPAGRVLGYGVLEVLSRVTEGSDESDAIRRALEGMQDLSSDQRLTPTLATATASTRMLRSHYLPIHADSGEVVGVAAMVRDVSEEHRIRQDLRETDARFRAMADAAPVLLWMSRTDGLCTFFNQTWLEFTGRTMKEEWGVGWAESVHFEDLEACMDTYITAFNQRAVFEMEYRLRRRDGEYRWILDRGTPRYAPDGRFAGYIGSCIDITERRRLEAELRGGIEARDDFLSVASHELGTPLTALRLHVDQLKRAVKSGAVTGTPGKPLDKRIDSIEREVIRLANLVETLLDTTRLAAGARKLNLEGFELGPLVTQVVHDMTPVADAAGCQIKLASNPTSPGRWDRTRLERAVTNILGNAFKFGAGKPVEVTVEGDGETASVRIRDNGIGLPAGEQELIFQRFGRAPGTRGYGGLGLGLWIARQSVEAMGGTIRVHSVPNEGATFEIVLRCVWEP